ncbi:MAG: PIN domain-containing protein [Melioribacteraceae bacterium]|nr:PIN domain-containing protein [Melioribacteraceae bacterium]MCF8266283.1 PIN domain-containing protein [Melioribacteraceae bacterium]MCF8432638.1 PIN domain-containing protein [Melioribacteraceae bacterium]
MRILVDSSIWIDYFRGGKNSEVMDSYIDENVICTNHLILSELIPNLRIRKEKKIIDLLTEISIIPLNINWNQIIEYQTICLKNGINKVGIPDLIIVDNAIQNDLILFSNDKHFKLIYEYIALKLVKI